MEALQRVYFSFLDKNIIAPRKMKEMLVFEAERIPRDAEVLAVHLEWFSLYGLDGAIFWIPRKSFPDKRSPSAERRWENQLAGWWEASPVLTEFVVQGRSNEHTEIIESCCSDKGQQSSWSERVENETAGRSAKNPASKVREKRTDLCDRVGIHLFASCSGIIYKLLAEEDEEKKEKTKKKEKEKKKQKKE